VGVLSDLVKKSAAARKEAADQAAIARAIDARKAAMAGNVAGDPAPPRRTPSTGNPLLEALEVAEVAAPARAGAVDPAELARLSKTEPYGQIPYQIDPDVRQDALVRSAVDAEGNSVISETGVRPTRLVKRRSRGEGGSDAERMWVTPTGDGRYQISSEGGTTLDTVATEDQVRDLLRVGGWSWDSGPKLDVSADLPDPQMVGRALLEYSREPGAVGNLARAVADLEVLRKADPALYEQAIGVAGGGAIDDATPVNVQSGLRLAQDAARATALAADQPAGAARAGIGEADIPTTAGPRSEDLAARVAAAKSAASPLGVRLPTSSLVTQAEGGEIVVLPSGLAQRTGTQIQIGGDRPPVANAVRDGSELVRPQNSIGGFNEPAYPALTPQDARGTYRPIVRSELPRSELGPEVPIGVSKEDVGILGGRRRSSSMDVGAGGEVFVVPQEVPSGPLEPIPGPQAMGPESPTMDARSSSILDDLLPSESPSMQDSMAFQINPGSWASEMFGGRRDDLADLIRSAQGLDPFTFSTGDMPQMGGVDTAQMPVTLRQSAVRDVMGPAYSPDGLPTGGGNANIPRFITDEELAQAFTRQQPTPSERFITNNDPGLSTGSIEEIERRVDELTELRQALEARALFAEEAAQQGRMTIAELTSTRAEVMNQIGNLNREADQLARQAETMSGPAQQMQGFGSTAGGMGGAARSTMNVRLQNDPAANLSSERYYVLDNIENLRAQLRGTRPERMAAEGAARKQRNVMDDLAPEMRGAASNVQDQIRRLESILEREGLTYGPIDQDALRRQAAQDVAERELQQQTDVADLNQTLSQGSDSPDGLSADELRQIADDVLQPKRDPNAIGRSEDTGVTYSRPAAFGAYDSRTPDGRPSEEFLREVKAKQQEIDDLMPSDASLMSEDEIETIAKEQARLQKRLNKELAQWSGDAQGSAGVNLPMVTSRKTAGAAQAAMVDKLLTGSPEERMQALNDLFSSKVRGEYTAFKDPETGRITKPKADEPMPDAGVEMVRNMDEANQRWDTRLQKYVGTGEWRPFDAARDAGREDEIRLQNFQPVPVKVRSSEGAFGNIQKMAADPRIGSVENLMYQVLRLNADASRSMAPDALLGAAQRLAADVERVAPRAVSADAAARVGAPSFTQRLQAAVENFNLGRPTDFVPETTPVDNLVNLLPDAEGLRNAAPGQVSSELSQVRYIEQKARELEEMGYDVTPVRDQIARIMPALEESYRPPASMAPADSAPQIQLSQDPEELLSQIEALKMAADQERSAGNLDAAARLEENITARRSQLASAQRPSARGAEDAVLRGANEDVSPVLHSTERPGDFVSSGAFSIPLDGDIGDAIRSALSGDLYPGQSASAVGAPEVEVLQAPPRVGPEISVESPSTPGVFIRRPSMIPQAKIVVRRKYKGGVEPAREFVVDVAQPGEVRPGSATLELGQDGRSFFFVNDKGAEPLPSVDEAADTQVAERIARAGRARTSEDDALRITAGGNPQILGSRGWSIDTSNLNNRDQVAAPVEDVGAPASLPESERPVFNEGDVGDSGMDRAGTSPRAARLARAAVKSRTRSEIADGKRFEAESDVAVADARRRQAEAEAPSDGTQAPAAGRSGAVKRGAIGLGGAALLGLGGKVGLDYLAGDEVQAAPILASTLVAEPAPEDTNSSAESVLDRIRQARQYQSYLVSGNMMPR